MANFTAYPIIGTAPEQVLACFSFLGNGAAQVIETKVWGARGILQKPYSGTGINRTGAGLFTLNFRDGYFGAIPYQATATVNQQAIIGFSGTVFQVAAAAVVFVVPTFATTDLITLKQLTFRIETAATPTLADPSTSQLVSINLVLLNSTAQ